MFTSALVVIAPNWKQPRCPSVDEWISKSWSIPTLECCLVIKRNELLTYAAIWVKGIEWGKKKTLNPNRVHKLFCLQYFLK